MQRKGKLRKGIASSKSRQRQSHSSGCRGHCKCRAIKYQKKSLSKGVGSGKLYRASFSDPSQARARVMAAAINAHGYDIYCT